MCFSLLASCTVHAKITMSCTIIIDAYYKQREKKGSKLHDQLMWLVS